MNASLQNLTAIAADLNAAGKTVSIKRLPTRKMRKGEGLSRDQQHGKGAAVGSGFHCRPINSLGGRPVKDLAAIQKRAAAVYAADRRSAVMDRAAGL